MRRGVPRGARRRRVFGWVALAGAGTVGAGNLVEAAMTGGVDAIDVWPFVVVGFAAGELLKGYGRERAARIAQAVASVLLAAVSLWLGGAAAEDLALGRGADWLDLATGVLGLLYVAVGAAILADRFRRSRVTRAV
ncbi:hypothetical protein ACFYXH_07215 [Streptomyces sp. NPDC002730]|uniref:hypothetical protein n=1 Tax=Streptomyces sp. NPDC002730 TaxID=3364662 RepID=UPI0036C617BB